MLSKKTKPLLGGLHISEWTNLQIFERMFVHVAFVSEKDGRLNQKIHFRDNNDTECTDLRVPKSATTCGSPSGTLPEVDWRARVSARLNAPLSLAKGSKLAQSSILQPSAD